MRRSAKISLILIGTVSTVGACKSESDSDVSAEEAAPQEGVFFSSDKDCEAHYSKDECDQLATEKTRPAFSSKADCEETYGAGSCEQVAGNGGASGGSSDGTGTGSKSKVSSGPSMTSMFLPAWGAYMVGRHMSMRGNAGVAPTGPKPIGFVSEPGSAMRPHTPMRASTVIPSSKMGSSNRSSVTRGGFGTTGRSFSSPS